MMDINGFTEKYNNLVDDPESKYEFFIYVKHVPTKTNYLHFEFSIKNDQNEEISQLNNKGCRKVVSSTIISRIQDVAVFQIV